MATNKLKKMMQQEKTERAKQTKINSPLARYNNQNQLVCVVCKVVIKSDSLWEPHCLTQNHNNNIVSLKEEQSKKRKREGELKIEQKKKNALNPPSQTQKGTLPLQTQPAETSSIPKEEQPPKTNQDTPNGDQSTPQNTETPKQEKTSLLPNNFFDDPAKQAKYIEQDGNIELREEEITIHQLYESKRKEQAMQKFVVEEEIIDEDPPEQDNIPSLSQNVPPKEDSNSNPPKLETPPTETNTIAIPVEDEYDVLSSTVNEEILLDTLQRRKAFTTLQSLKEKASKIKGGTEPTKSLNPDQEQSDGEDSDDTTA